VGNVVQEAPSPRPSPRWGEGDTFLAYYDSIIGECTDLEVLARCAELAAERANGDVEDFIHQMGALIFGQVVPRAGILAGPMDRVFAGMWRRFGWAPRKTAVHRFGSSGFAYDDKSNQVQHFWYAVAVAYRWGPRIADLIARVIEWNPPKPLRWLPFSGRGTGTPEDLYLSRQGIELGRMIAERRIALGEVGQWVRRELGPACAPAPNPSPLGRGVG
jgi:hypothetical protein